MQNPSPIHDTRTPEVRQRAQIILAVTAAQYGLSAPPPAAPRGIHRPAARHARPHPVACEAHEQVLDPV
jgi:hypothetical protein